MDGGLFDVSFLPGMRGKVRILAKPYPLWMGKRTVVPMQLRRFVRQVHHKKPRK